MGFRENLKAQLEYSGLLIKELEAKSGVKKKTIESYLGNTSYTPNAEAAVKIAKALGVTVEFLVTGHNPEKNMPISALPKSVQEIVAETKKLHTKDQQIILNLARMLKSR